MKQNTLRHSLLLLLTAAIWGFAFVAQSVGMDYVQPFTFTAARSHYVQQRQIPRSPASYCFRLFSSGRRKPAGLPKKNPLPGNRRCPEASSAVFCCVSHRTCSRSAYNIRPLEKAGLSQQCTSCLFRYSVYFFTRKPVSACGSLWHLLYADCIFYV